MYRIRTEEPYCSTGSCHNTQSTMRVVSERILDGTDESTDNASLETYGRGVADRGLCFEGRFLSRCAGVRHGCGHGGGMKEPQAVGELVGT
jgi:hypothetical protein